MKNKKKGLVIFTVLLLVLFIAPVVFNYISEVWKQIELDNKQREFDELYDKSPVIIRNIHLEFNKSFEFIFAVKENDMFLFGYETYDYIMVLNIEMTLSNVTYKFLNTEYTLHKHFDFFINHTGIITCRLTHMGNMWHNHTGNVDLFVIVYNQYFPPSPSYPELNP